MLVTLQYGPNAGQERHVERNQITQLLLDLRLLELVQPPAPQPASTTPIFYLARSEYTGKFGIFVKMPVGEIRSAFDLPDKSRAETLLDAGEIPSNVWDDYAARTAAARAEVAQNARATAGNKWLK